MNTKGLPPACHPDRPYYGNSLCRQCYSKAWQQANKDKRHKWYLDHREEQLDKSRERYRKNPKAKLRYCKEYREKYPHKQRDQQLKRLYGITLEQYNMFVAQQDNTCKLCGMQPIKKPVVDHCHKTGKIRGVICQGCNILLGFFETRIDAVEQITRYLAEN